MIHSKLLKKSTVLSFVYLCKITEVNWVNLKYVNVLNTTALETEFLVLNQVFQVNTSHFGDILKVLKETPPETCEAVARRCSIKKVILKYI